MEFWELIIFHDNFILKNVFWEVFCQKFKKQRREVIRAVSWKEVLELPALESPGGLINNAYSGRLVVLIELPNQNLWGGAAKSPSLASTPDDSYAHCNLLLENYSKPYIGAKIFTVNSCLKLPHLSMDKLSRMWHLWGLQKWAESQV